MTINADKLAQWLADQLLAESDPRLYDNEFSDGRISALTQVRNLLNAGHFSDYAIRESE